MANGVGLSSSAQSSKLGSISTTRGRLRCKEGIDERVVCGVKVGHGYCARKKERTTGDGLLK